jgi:hypothetical protein
MGLDESVRRDPRHHFVRLVHPLSALVAERERMYHEHYAQQKGRV